VKLQALARSVRQDEVPKIVERVLYGARLAGLLAPWAILGEAILAVLTDNAIPERKLPVGLAVSAISLAMLWFTYTRWGRRHADLAMLGLALAVVWLLGADGWCAYDRTNSLIGYAPFIPVAFAMLVPWRPSHSVLVGVVCAAALPAVALTQDVTMSMWRGELVVMFGVVAAALNNQLQRVGYLELQRARDQLVAADRLVGLGQRIAGFAHELKTPLAAAMNEISTARTLVGELTESVGHPDVGEDDLREIAAELAQALSTADDGISRSVRFVRAVREHTRGLSSTSKRRFSVRERIDNVRTLLTHTARKSGRPIEVRVPAGVTLEGDAGKFDQIITNLCTNALEAMDGSGVGTRVLIESHQAADGLHLSVSDDGPGVPEALRDRIFEMLFTTRPDSGGVGIGLAICRELMQGVFGGRLELARTEVGTRFELYFPKGEAHEEQERNYRPFALGDGWRPA